MTAIERTAYPTFYSHPLTQQELNDFFTPTEKEIRFIRRKLRRNSENEHRKTSNYEQHCFNMIVLLKCFQRLGYFPPMRVIPKNIINHIRNNLQIKDSIFPSYKHTQVLYRHQAVIREFLNIRSYQQGGKEFATQIAIESAKVHNYPADIINQILEELFRKRYELPAYSQIDRLVKQVRHRINQDIFSQVHQQLSDKTKNKFDKLTINATRTAYNKLKELPKSTTITHFKELLTHHDWLSSLGSMSNYLKEITQIKRKHFAGEAKSLDASDMRDMLDAKRYTLIVCLVDEMQKQAKDHLVIMFIKTMKKIDWKAKEKLTELREETKEKTRILLTLLSDIVTTLGKKATQKRVTSVRRKLSDQGGQENILSDCEQAIAYHSDNHLPLIWQSFRGSRQALFNLLRAINIQSCTQNDSLIKAKEFLLHHANSKKDLLPADVDISFAPKQWQKLIIQKEGRKRWLIRRYFESCVFMCLANELKSTDLYVAGSATYTDFRDELLPWDKCLPMVAEYCENLNISSNGKSAVIQLRRKLSDKANEIDNRYPEIKELVIDEKGNPILKKRSKKSEFIDLQLESIIKSRMPKRKLIDVLVNVNHYTSWANVFGPISGSEPKIQNAVERYILMTFAYGTGMGPTQAAQHMRHDVSAHMLSWANQRHVTPAMQDKALKKIINQYKLFDLPKNWGTGKSAIADGTMRKIYQENLTAEYHIRYGSTGGIAYHHIADNYIALFSTFIPCGVWEAVEILEGLLRNESDIQPKIIHADTQGQSTVVFAIAFFLGIKLMPRIRNWKDLKFHRPDKMARYTHIDSLFNDNVDWNLMETHWQDMLQVVLSIKAGKISSSLLLRKLGSYSKRNKLCLALRELGYVMRTLFLLDYISDVDLREEITAQTNKVESYNGFTEWLSFGNPYTIVASNDPDEHEKAVKYNDIIANAVMFQNVLDMSNVLIQLHEEGYPFQRKELKHTSPLLRDHLNRFGEYVVNMNVDPVDIDRAMKLPV
jgi:TnpA family transposase